MKGSFPLILQMEYSKFIFASTLLLGWAIQFFPLFFFFFFETLKSQISLQDSHTPFPRNYEMSGVDKMLFQDSLEQIGLVDKT